MFPTTISNSNSLSEDAINVSSATIVHQDLGGGVLNHVVVSNSTISPQQPQKIKRKRSLPGNPDPDAEVIALSPKTLLATNRFVCEICHKGFQRDQNLQLHRRGHNLPWKLKQRNSKAVVRKKAYVCPEPSCVHHNPSRALGDLTGVKKHYCRKHGEKKWKCEKCSKIYAVQSDWKAHSKTCGTREYRCDCGTLFSRKDSFITHRAFCDALAEESARLSANQLASTTNPLIHSLFLFQNHQVTNFNPWDSSPQQNPNPSGASLHNIIKPEILAQTNFHNNHTLSNSPSPSVLLQQQQRPHKGMITSPFGNNLHVAKQQVPSSNNAATSAYMSATAVLQKAATVGSAANIEGPPSVADQQQRSNVGHVTAQLGTGEFGAVSHQLDSVAPEFMMSTLMRGLIPTTRSRLTRDFLGLTADAADGGNGGGAVDVSMNVRDMLAFTGGVEYHQQPRHNYALLKPQQQGFGYLGTTTVPETWGNT